MRFNEMGRSKLLIVVLALAAGLLAFLDAQRPGAVQATTPAPAPSDRTPEASAAEAAITASNLVGRLEAALGGAYGGVWFDPEAAQLHVGVTSPASRLAAETVAAQVGLTDTVTETPVDSTWAELDAAQERWDRRLLDLLERGEVATALVAERNAVRVELGSEVSSSRRAALEGEAATEEVDVKIAVAPRSRIRVVPTARCNEFAVGKAFCDPTLVAGVTFDSVKNEAGVRQSCTAGPTVLPKDRSNAAQATKTYVLTAGHCLDDAGGVGKKWYAYNTEGEPKGEHEVGTATAYLDGKTDIGVVEVNTTYWAKANNFIPVIPTIAPWNRAEPEPFAVIDQSNPAEKTKSCLAGKKVGIGCGEIIHTNQTIEVGGVVTENLIEVKGVKGEIGDSGGPWFAAAKFEEVPPEGFVEGTQVGFKGANQVFHSLKTSFEKLKNEKALDLELLKTSNEKRHPFKFATEAAPTVLTGSQHSASKTAFSFSAGVVSCASAGYTGELTGTGPIEMSLTPVYGGCATASGPVTVDVNGCSYKFTPQAKVSGNFEGRVDILCPAGKKIEFTAPGCTITVGPQPDRTTLTYTNLGAGATREITIDLNLVALAYEEHSAFPPNCASNTVPKVTGTVSGSILVKGETGAKAHRGIWVE